MSFLLNLLGGISGQIYIYLAVLLAGFGSGFWVEHSALVNFKQELQIASEQQIAENKAKLKEQEIINENIEKTYKASVASIHSYYSGMLNSRSRPVSSVPNATITVNGETQDAVVVAESCAIETAKLVSLQDWINQQVGLNK